MLLAPPFLTRASVLEFRLRQQFDPRSYYAALCVREGIFNKSGNIRYILHGASDVYYNLLLSLPDLAPLEALTDAELLHLKKEDIPNPAKRSMLCLEEGNLGVEDDLGVIEPDDVADVAVPPAIALAAPLVPVVLPEPPIAYKHWSVHFDNYSHSSGYQRAFVGCALHGANGRCRRYQYVRNFPSRRHCAAWLFAWAMDGHRFKDPADFSKHIEWNPDDEDVAVVLSEL